MDTPAAQKVAKAIASEWDLLTTLLDDALTGHAYEALGYANAAEWLAELLPDRTLPGLGPIEPPKPTGPRPARVSQPGKRESTRPRPAQRGTSWW